VLEKLAAMPAITAHMQEEIGDVWRREEKFDKALPYYDLAIAAIKKPEAKDWPVFFARGMCHERLKDWAKAEPDLQQALDLDPENAQVLNYLGYSWADQGNNLEKAHDLIGQALEQTPNDPYILDSMGWVLYRMGEFDKAVSYLEESAADLSSDVVINDHLGDAYWQVGRVVEAQVQWQRALSAADPKADDKLIETLKQKLLHGIQTKEKTNDNN
jgi:tetratricopeptide (TPR) repeat protein